MPASANTSRKSSWSARWGDHDTALGLSEEEGVEAHLAVAFHVKAETARRPHFDEEQAPSLTSWAQAMNLRSISVQARLRLHLEVEVGGAGLYRTRGPK